MCIYQLIDVFPSSILSSTWTSLWSSGGLNFLGFPSPKFLKKLNKKNPLNREAWGKERMLTCHFNRNRNPKYIKSTVKSAYKCRMLQCWWKQGRQSHKTSRSWELKWNHSFKKKWRKQFWQLSLSLPFPQTLFPPFKRLGKLPLKKWQRHTLQSWPPPPTNTLNRFENHTSKILIPYCCYKWDSPPSTIKLPEQ